MKKWFNDILFSFPVQLLGLHCRNNLLLVFIWLLLMSMVTGSVGQVFGVKYLFLAPEYLEEVGFLSFFFLGLAFGGFFITWNLTSYLLDAHLFPFLASLGRPFTKFCLNNFPIPLTFLTVYFYTTIHFQYHNEFWSAGTIFYNCLGFVLGMIALILLSALYFQYTNKDILNFLKIRNNKPPNLLKTIAPGGRNLDYEAIKSPNQKWRVDTYLTESFRPRIVRSVAHYDIKTLQKVFRQNHLNALIVQLFGLVVLIAFGYLIDTPSFRIPAAANFMILSSVMVAITGAVTYWFDQWKYTVLIVVLFVVNYLTGFDMFNHKNKAYGLDYTKELATYSYEKLDSISRSSIVEKDKVETIRILDNWKSKATQVSGEKPKMIIFCVSGGGLKAAVWAMQVMQQADSLTHGDLMNHTALITGASGGMIGVSYLREIYLRKIQGDSVNVYDQKYIDNISKDLLNSITFTIVSNDLFLPWTTFETGGHVYKKDRGYIFEKQLNENTDNAFTKTIGEYKEVEQKAKIPMLYLTPSIVNDGRRMIISPHGVSFMTIAPIGVEKRELLEIDAVDFGKVFGAQDAQNLLFSTALRMNATYPYILPNVHLPSKPGIEVMDAGFRDNFGITSATRFMHVFNEWIKENTSGVVLVQVSSLDKIEEIPSSNEGGVLETMFNPLGIAGQIMNLQDYEQDTNLGFIYDILGKENFEIIRFIYHPGKNNERASLTFHLTQREKENILNSFYMAKNQESMKRLLEVMKISELVKD
jgi:patatin-like phospholipase